ncbi:MAG: hypothetical protein GX808_01335 [Syntrophomonadaceae bacterium]|nr:hypothetical protein [Syntrophomonadaceae bacterium]
MRKMERKVITAVISAVVTLAVLLSGYTFYNKYIVQAPLLEAIDEMASVNQVQISKEKSKYQITVELNRVENLQHEYAQLEKIAAANLGSKEYDLKISAAGDQQLQDFYYQIQPFIYEALAKDNFMWLNEQIKQQITRENGKMDYRFFVDNEMIYLQFENGRENLYEIIPRDADGQKIQA